MTESGDDNTLPEAVPAPRRRWSPQWVWLIPVLAAAIGAWLAVHAILSRGPTITIAFKSAEGLEAGKTRIKYKDVDIGEVTRIRVSQDRKSVLVTADLVKEAEDFLVKDSRFWIVKPRIAGGSVSGLGTLLSGAYIGMDVGKSGETVKTFTGLDVPPIVTADLPGRQFLLKAEDLGSLSVGTPVYFRRVPVGQVEAYALDPSGKGINLTLFINAPYDRFVTPDTRFWHASGLDVSIGANGLKINTESLSAIALGGVAFETPSTGLATPPAAPSGTAFLLAANREQALQNPDREVQPLRLTFRQSLRGLSVGAPVEFRGIVVGEVTSIGVEYDKTRRDFSMPVEIRTFPSRIRELFAPAERTQALDRKLSPGMLVKHGLRAQLRMGSLFTGQQYIALDFFPEAPPARVTARNGVMELPTVDGDIEELQRTVQRVARRLDKIPLDRIGLSLEKTLGTLDRTLSVSGDAMGQLNGKVLPETLKALEDLQKTLHSAEASLRPDSPMQEDVRGAMQEVRETARSVRALSDYLERHPEALIRGKEKDTP
ncbi:PqiB family protein [Paludibacterium paludis]|uniref:Paraquat-inducible protein n=1 Tax=Paludibacterium paludis TaxID=1225769 RepID=A0A918P234_9NEIS|nr:MlaD family protein [Paludibacterium paludis]GGY13389.1 paraquat-inducible protein [Paludibacterium paludis]